MKSTQWLVVGFVVFTVSVVGLLMGGQFFGLKTPDAGWMLYCPLFEETSKDTTLEDRYIRYFYTGDGPNDENLPCDEPVQVQLDPERRPWKVYAEKGLADDVAYASREWNDRVGCVLFTSTKDPEQAYITAKREASEGGTAGGYTQHWADERIGADIVIFNITLTSGRQRAIAHELGHALGLAHDAFEDSIMYPGTNGSSYFTDEDVERVEARYCP